MSKALYICGSITFIFGCILIIIIGSFIIHKHREVASWYDGSTTISENTNSTVITNFREFYPNARILGSATVDEENAIVPVGSIIPIELRFPAPPEKLNINGRDDIKDWIRFVEGSPNLSILIDLEGGTNSDGRYQAVTENIKIVGWIIGILIAIISIIMFVVIIVIMANNY